MGDINCECSVNDRLPADSYIDRSARFLGELLDNFDLFDIGWHPLSTGQLQFTHFQGSFHARLDRIYASVAFLYEVKNYSVTYLLFGSLRATVRSGERTKPQFNSHPWKFNQQLFNDRVFPKELDGCFSSLILEGLPFFERWELFKQEVKTVAIECSSILLFRSHEHARELQGNLRLLCHLECANPGCGVKDIQFLKSQLNELAVEGYRGTVERLPAER